MEELTKEQSDYVELLNKGVVNLPREWVEHYLVEQQRQNYRLYNTLLKVMAHSERSNELIQKMAEQLELIGLL